MLWESIGGKFPHLGDRNKIKKDDTLYTTHIYLGHNQSHPTQYHKIKKETFFVVFGKIEIVINGKKNTLKQGEMVTILPKQTHRFKDISETGSVIEEFSTESFKDDSYYLDKSIQKNKNRKSFISLVK